MMSDAELLKAMAVASALNTLSVVVGILINVAKLKELRAHVEALFDNVDRCFDAVDRGFHETRDPKRLT
jgi:hypothetical protein